MSRSYLILFISVMAIFSLGILFACQGDDDPSTSSGQADDDDNDDNDDNNDNDDATPDDDDNGGGIAENITDSGCINAYQTIHQDGTFDENLTLDWDGEGTIAVYHGHTCYNCGFDLALVTYQVEGGVLEVVETSQEDFMAADCMCLFEYTYDLLEIPPGDYTLELYRWYREEGGAGEPELKWQEAISLPAGQPDQIEFSEYHDEGCG